jgi:hypothetical protein
MPTSLACFDRALVDGIPETEQTIDSPDLFTRHPIQDGLQMHLKGKRCDSWLGYHAHFPQPCSS